MVMPRQLPAAGARERIGELEDRLGDALDPANPVGHRAVLAADRAGALPDGAEELLDGAGMNREFVPASLGGRLDGLDTAGLLLRAVARRDFGLGFAYGAASFIPALTVWCDGSPAQQARVAELCLGGGRLAMACQSLVHDNAFASNGIWARPRPDGGVLLGGRKLVMNNANRAEGFVVVAGTGRSGREDGNCAVYFERAELPDGVLRDLVSPPDVGPRRCPVGGVELLDCELPERAVLGGPTGGTRAMLHTFQTTRPLLPSMAIGCADTALRTAALFAARESAGSGGVGNRLRRLGSRYARRALAAAFLDLLVCDALVTAATRGVHLLPRETSVSTAGVKFLVPRLLSRAITDLIPLFGGAGRDGDEFGRTFRLHLRDLSELPPGRTGEAASLASVVPQLTTLAARVWPQETGLESTPPAGLFRAGAALPAPVPGQLTPAAPTDTLAALLLAAAGRAPFQPGGDGAGSDPIRRLGRTVCVLAGEFLVLRKECMELAGRGPGSLASPRAFALAERYLLLQAAAACIGLWEEYRADEDGSGFLADPAWLEGALVRIAVRLGLSGELPSGPAEHDGCPVVLVELARRLEDGRSLDALGSAPGGGGRGL